MAGKREKPEDIVTKLRQIEVLQGQGMPIADAVRQVGTTQQTYYRWRKLYGGMGWAQLKRLKELEKENQHLRRAVSDLTLDKLILTEAWTTQWGLSSRAVAAGLDPFKCFDRDQRFVMAFQPVNAVGLWGNMPEQGVVAARSPVFRAARC